MATYLVTGVTGFVGRALALRLLREGHEVRGISRRSDPDLVKSGLRLINHDIASNAAMLSDACQGVEAVFHVAAKVDMWGRYQDFYNANVIGTRNILEACRASKVGALVYTSSPSVIAGGEDLKGVDETVPYPTKYLSYYPSTKALAEQEVLSFGLEGKIRSVALRPHLIFGPGDTNLVPTILERARNGRLVRVGTGDNLTDLTFIDDCVEAHLCALRSLKSNPSISGRAYFISQGQPVNLWGWIDEVLVRHGLPKVAKSLPKWVAYSIASLLEGMARVIPGNIEPLFTRFLVCEMATSHFFNITAARRDLGFVPRFSIEQAMRDTFMSDSRNELLQVGGIRY